jgi:hypothetical protein
MAKEKVPTLGPRYIENFLIRGTAKGFKVGNVTYARDWLDPDTGEPLPGNPQVLDGPHDVDGPMAEKLLGKVATDMHRQLREAQKAHAALAETLNAERETRLHGEHVANKLRTLMAQSTTQLRELQDELASARRGPGDLERRLAALEALAGKT